MKDKIVDAVIKKFSDRSESGIKKYGTTLERGDLTISEWLTHLQEELMDATLYIEKLKSEVATISSQLNTDITKEFWESAEKITHDGYVYIRYNDLPFCK